MAKIVTVIISDKDVAAFDGLMRGVKAQTPISYFNKMNVLADKAVTGTIARETGTPAHEVAANRPSTPVMQELTRDVWNKLREDEKLPLRQLLSELVS